MSIGLATRGYLGGTAGLATRGYESRTRAPVPDPGVLFGSLAEIGRVFALLQLEEVARATLAEPGEAFALLQEPDTEPRIRGTLAEIGRLFGLLQIGQSMIDIVGSFTWWRGTDKKIRITITDDEDARIDLGTVTAIEFQIKATPGGADPPLVSKALGAGIVALTQSGDTLGQADITVDGSDTASASAIPDGIYWLDVIAVVAAKRKQVIEPLEFVIRTAVNPP